jgi:hypothetical protein
MNFNDMEDKMKRFLWSGMAFFLLMMSVNAMAGGDMECYIYKQSTDIPKLKKEITQNVENGLIPEGISYDGNELYVMYMTEPNTVMKSWSLEVYENDKELKAGLDKNMENGLFPTGMTANGGNIFVLFTEEEGLKVTGYSFINTSWETMEEDLKDDFDEGYIPVGIAVDEEGNYFVLMVTIENTKVTEWNVEEYAVGEHQDAIDKKIAEGYFPCGFEAGDDWVHVLYVKM